MTGPMQKKLLAGLFWVLLANLLVKPFWILGIEVEVQNAVGNAAYGFYYALWASPISTRATSRSIRSSSASISPASSASSSACWHSIWW